VYFAHWARFAAGPATEASEKKGLGWGAREASAANQRLRFGRLRLVGTAGVLSSQPFLSFPLWLCRSKIQAPLISDLRRRVVDPCAALVPHAGPGRWQVSATPVG